MNICHFFQELNAIVESVRAKPRAVVALVSSKTAAAREVLIRKVLNLKIVVLTTWPKCRA